MQGYILLFIPVLMLCHTSKNNSDVIVTYEGHAEANSDFGHPVGQQELPQQPKPLEDQHQNDQLTEPARVTERDEVVFVPNEREGQDDGYITNANEAANDEKTVGNLLNGRRNIDDIVQGTFNMETEPPQNKDVVFVTGKNKEQAEDFPSHKEQHSDIVHSRRSQKKTTDKIPITSLNCSNLDCNKTSSPVCGGKMEHNRWRYRLFLNECFFRKVNCRFNYDINRYIEVERDRCHNPSTDFIQRQIYRPDPPQNKNKEVIRNDTRRLFSGRRSSNTGLDGQYCSHVCPSVCPEDYNPECAISNTGEKRVFVNHCKLDFNSCVNNIAWHRKPLSECIGTKAADLRQNRGFISWMHRIGIIDAKGRLTISD